MTRHIPLDKRLLLIERARELHRQGLGYRRIQRILYEEYGVHIHRSTLSYWLRNIHTPYGRIKQLDKTDMDSYAYIIGASIGDAYLRMKKDVEGYMKHLIIMRVRDREFIEEYNRRLMKIIPGLKPKIKQGRRGFYETTIYNKLLWLEIKKYQENPSKIYQDLKNNKQHFLKGIYDAEGFISVSVGRFFSGSICLINTSYDLCSVVSRFLTELGMYNRIETIDRRGEPVVVDGWLGRVNKIVYIVIFSSYRNIIRFRDLIGFTIRRKMEKLNDFIEIRVNYGYKSEAKQEWMKRYVKIKNRWIKKKK